jgi:hypothetical protein
VVPKAGTQSRDFLSNFWAVVSKARVSARADVADNVVALADAPNVELNEPAEFWDDNLLTPIF